MEVLDDLVLRDQVDLAWHHEDGQDEGKDGSLKGKPQTGEGITGQRAQDKLAEGTDHCDQDGHSELVEER